MIFLHTSHPGTLVGMVYVSKENCVASNMTTCAHHQLGHKNVNFLCIHVKGLVTLKFIFLHLALVVFIITDNQDFIPEACVSRESHYNKRFLFTSICLSPSLYFIPSLVLLLYRRLSYYTFLFFFLHFYSLSPLFMCVFDIFAYNTENDLNLDRSY